MNSYFDWFVTTVQLTTFRPLASNKAVTGSATSNAVTIDGTSTSTSTAPRLRVRALESSDTSDYENLSACTSGRYATLPPQPQFGSSGASGGFYRDHYAAAAAGVVFRPHSSGDTGGVGGVAGYFQHRPTSAAAGPIDDSGNFLAPQNTLSLHRPVKRSHWVNHNGRPSDVLARVLQANQDWLDPIDPLNTIRPLHRSR